MFDSDIRSALDPGPAHGASVALHAVGLLAVAALTLTAPPEIAPAIRPPAPVWLLLPDPSPAPPAKPLVKELPPPPAARLFTPPESSIEPPPAAAAPVPPAPEVQLQAPDAALPAAPLAAVPPPRIQLDQFAGLAAPAAPKPNPALPIQPAGFGSAAASPARTGPRSRPVVTGGFSTGSAAPPEPPRAATVRSGGFSDLAAAPAAQPGPKEESPRPDTPAEILDKPRPAYTDEARRLQIEGEVVLRVRFAASGSVEVLTVVSGLGHGLDEKAIDAARRIRFRPALASGMPVDSAATVHIFFQLAY